jgi:putative transport protein
MVHFLISYSANLTLQQFGLILFLAGVGTRAGNAFITTAPPVMGSPCWPAGPS